MLIDSNNRVHFYGKTRNAINAIVSGHCKTESCAERHQAEVLAPLKEVFTTNRFSLQDCMSKPFVHCSKGERL